MKDIHDVIKHAKFGDDRLRGSGVVAGQTSAFPIDFAGRPYNTLTLPCERVICRPASQTRRKQFECGGYMASAEREPIRGSGGRAPSGVQGQSQTLLQPTSQPWSGGQGASPPEAERFLGIIRRKDRQYLPLYLTFESAEISPIHCLESK